MKKVVGIRFKSAGKVYDFDSGLYVLNIGDHVIVETEQGLSFGTVAVLPVELSPQKASNEYKKVFRIANESDLEQLAKNQETERTARDYCVNCISQLNLNMNLFAVESTFDTSKLTFFFTAEGRVDFRQLVKMLVKQFRVRIEMRQVGIRNQAKMCGGIGRCGRGICCATFLEKFEPISIRMAKEQGLSLNPTKISGLCGRLMCCLTYENDVYITLKEKFPKIGTLVETKKGKGKIIRHNVICNRVAIKTEDNMEIEISLGDIIEQNTDRDDSQGSEIQKKETDTDTQVLMP